MKKVFRKNEVVVKCFWDCDSKFSDNTVIVKLEGMEDHIYEVDKRSLLPNKQGMYSTVFHSTDTTFQVQTPGTTLRGNGNPILPKSMFYTTEELLAMSNKHGWGWKMKKKCNREICNMKRVAYAPMYYTDPRCHNKGRMMEHDPGGYWFSKDQRDGWIKDIKERSEVIIELQEKLKAEMICDTCGQTRICGDSCDNPQCGVRKCCSTCYFFKEKTSEGIAGLCGWCGKTPAFMVLKHKKITKRDVGLALRCETWRYKDE